MMADLTHFDARGNAQMVDVGHKDVTSRKAIASGRVEMKPETATAIRESRIGKGDVLQVARLAGIMASKQTSSLIPLCHMVALSSVEIDFELHASSLDIRAVVTASDRTGVEMEALVAVTTAALTVYDMCKSIDRGIAVQQIRLEEKSGGKSGHFVREKASD
jgi:cyclic pyranopterin phosphate synthase